MNKTISLPKGEWAQLFKAVVNDFQLTVKNGHEHVISSSFDEITSKGEWRVDERTTFMEYLCNKRS